jgi:hypothetical protein
MIHIRRIVLGIVAVLSLLSFYLVMQSSMLLNSELLGEIQFAVGVYVTGFVIEYIYETMKSDTK